MEDAHAGILGQSLQGRSFFRPLDESADFFDFGRVCGRQREARRFAPLARAKAGFLRISSARVKTHVFRSRQTRGTRRPAVDSRGCDGVEEFSIRILLTRHNRLPAWVTDRRSGTPVDFRQLSHSSFLTSLLNCSEFLDQQRSASCFQIPEHGGLQTGSCGLNSGESAGRKNVIPPRNHRLHGMNRLANGTVTAASASQLTTLWFGRLYLALLDWAPFSRLATDWQTISTSSAVVCQLHTLILIALLPCHVVPVKNAVPDARMVSRISSVKSS